MFQFFHHCSTIKDQFTKIPLNSGYSYNKCKKYNIHIYIYTVIKICKSDFTCDQLQFYSNWVHLPPHPLLLNDCLLILRMLLFSFFTVTIPIIHLWQIISFFTAQSIWFKIIEEYFDNLLFFISIILFDL